MSSYGNEIDNFLKDIANARKKSANELIKLDDNTLAFIRDNSVEILTKVQKELVELLVDGAKTGAELARLTQKTDPKGEGKSPQFISKYMGKLVKFGIVDHIKAPFGKAMFYVLTSDIIGKEEINKIRSEAIPTQIRAEVEKRGVLGNLMSLSFKEILDLIRELDDNEKQKVLDFIIEYCQVEED